MKTNFVYYEMRGNAVVIHDGQGEIVINKNNLVSAIETIENNRLNFATQKHYENFLKVYVDALNFLDANQ